MWEKQMLTPMEFNDKINKVCTKGGRACGLLICFAVAGECPSVFK